MSIRIDEVRLEAFQFPTGERHVRLCEVPTEDVTIHFRFDNISNDIVDLMLLKNALQHCRVKTDTIFMEYVPFSRQDRVMREGEPLSIEVMAEIINSFNARMVFITDPHSDVTPALIKNCIVTTQADQFASYLCEQSGFYLISPDGGALKKIYKLAEKVDCIDVIECSKKRNVATGEISGVIVHSNDLNGKDCYIVDDICDGGRTFIEIAKILKTKNCGHLVLMVSHGFFTKGREELERYFDDIITIWKQNDTDF